MRCFPNSMAVDTNFLFCVYKPTRPLISRLLLARLIPDITSQITNEVSNAFPQHVAVTGNVSSVPRSTDRAIEDSCVMNAQRDSGINLRKPSAGGNVGPRETASESAF
jgi:hypothetical protein